MKKLFVAVAVVLMAGGLVSCGDTEKCYEITMTYTLAGIQTSTKVYSKTTENNIKDAEAEAKATVVKYGISEDAIEITSKVVADSNCK